MMCMRKGHHSRNLRRFVAGVLFASTFLGSSKPAWSQANSATLYGKVTDPTGSVVPSAVVSLISQETGTTTTKTADENGDFGFTFVPVGTYTLRIEAKGFRPFAATGIALTAGQQARQTFKLELGAVTDTVTV